MSTNANDKYSDGRTDTTPGGDPPTAKPSHPQPNQAPCVQLSGQRPDGTWKGVWATRDRALQQYYQKHPERFHARPRTPTPAEQVGINLPREKQPAKST